MIPRIWFHVLLLGVCARAEEDEMLDDDDFLDEIMDEFTTMTADVRHILVKTEDKFKEVTAAIHEEMKKRLEIVDKRIPQYHEKILLEVFAKVALDKSECLSKHRKGIISKDLKPKESESEYNEAVFENSAVGKLFGPVQSRQGIHLLLVTRRGKTHMIQDPRERDEL
eukprot:gnl/MRDRNA2_/MRDRNA2_101437_c0_seq1.p1 gnl/MRDRNA2_/MRDRNA2_101437_c0~~gnl/MRDRNA2_/MRDRNA2_101437_c0_seq1.p1  ORF type:complete len:168 (-),score=36.09 gnl/MRDRNA2_/MRDRNA2_101437_c0_seq1:21-524(-)